MVEASKTKLPAKKLKKKHSESIDGRTSLDGNPDIYLGITETKDGGTFEVWAHEDCIVWSPGVYLIGPRIVGLEEAVWTSCNVLCVKCRYRGANVSCLRRGCMNVAHYGCASAANWQLQADDFRAYCPEHRSA